MSENIQPSIENYTRFFFATLLSLIGVDYFVFTQGWYLLDLTGQNVSVGLAWTVFFIPSLLLFPLVGYFLKNGDLKKTLVRIEFAKAGVIALSLALVQFFPCAACVHLTSALLGVTFSLFYPASYVVLKRVSPPGRDVKLSHLFEISLQLAGVIALLSSGFIYRQFGFTAILSAALICLLAGALLTLSIRSQPTMATVTVRGMWQSYTQFAAELRAIKRGHKLTPKDFFFSVIHQLPQNLILVSNIPLLIYVSRNMQKTAVEYGVMDSVFSLGAMLTGFFWARYSEASLKKKLLTLTSLAAAATFALYSVISPAGYAPYALLFVQSLALISAKMLARARVIHSMDADTIATLSPAFQFTSSAVLVSLSFLVTLACATFAVPDVYLFFSAMLVLFAVFSR